jgi:hypothetical protein
MRLIRKKSEPTGLLDDVSHSFQTLGDKLPKARPLHVGLVAGGVVAVTAGSAAVSLLRRRLEGAGINS